MNRRDFIQIGSYGLLVRLLTSRTQIALFAQQGDSHIIQPEVSDDVLINPGMGFETFHCFNGDERDVRADNYPECSIAYFRLDWDVLEPKEGKYDFDLIDALLQKAQASRQGLALRFMPTRPTDLARGTPQWYKHKGAGYWYNKSNRKGWAPDHNDEYFLAKQEELVTAFGEKYNGHRDIIRMDIGSVGFWGEWHMSHTEPAVPMIDEKNAIRIIDSYLRHWDKTPLSMLIGYVPGLRYAVGRGTGWRADSLGDYGHFSDTWCHMRDSYPQRLSEAGAKKAWKNGPVAFEPPGSMSDLDKYVPDRGGGYDKMWGKALDWHGSSFNAKSRSIYPHQVPPIRRFLERCGYRIFLSRVVLPAAVSAQKRHLPIAIELENIGVAPPYRDYILAVKLTSDAGPIVLESVARTRDWLPGRHIVEENLPLPELPGSGRCTVAVGLLDPSDRQPAIGFGNERMGLDGWYPLSTIRLSS